MPPCPMCKKKSHILLKCKCENSYCTSCLQSEKHYCTYNYKKDTIKLEKIKGKLIEQI